LYDLDVDAELLPGTEHWKAAIRALEGCYPPDRDEKGEKAVELVLRA